MRLLYIDPFARVVLSTHEESRHAARLLQARRLDIAKVSRNHCLVFDADGLLKPWIDQRFFRLADRIVAGRAAIVRVGAGGGTMDCAIPVERLCGAVQWVQPFDVVVPAPCVRRFEDGVIDSVLPVDGDATHWTFRRQPSSSFINLFKT